MKIIDGGGGLGKKVGGLVFPMFARTRDFASLSLAQLWALRAAALTTVLGLLWGINSQFEWLIKGPWHTVNSLWLPLVFLLMYVLLWLAQWYWSQLSPNRQDANFPDIDRAWGEVLQALARAGLSLQEAPLFLVLGRTQSPEPVLFNAAGLHLKLRGVPDRDDAPVRVYASRDAIYLTCGGASVLGQFVAPPDEAEFEATRIPESAQTDSIYGGQSGYRTINDVKTIGSWRDSNEEEQAGTAKPAGSTREKAEAEIQGARLRHLGHLISQERRPYCPINGVLLLIPVAATNSDLLATRVGLLCQRDLAMVRQSMPVRCPVYALVCDFETLPGFTELVQRMPEDQRRRRMGQRFPLIPDVEPTRLPNVYELGIDWIAARQFPTQVDQLWRVESTGELSAADAVRGNVRLYRFLSQIRDRHRRLGRVITRAILTDGTQTAMLGGCYLAGTGSEPATEQAFIPGVFRRLTESQDLVSWSPELLAQEKRYHRWTRRGYVILVVISIIYAATFGVLYANRNTAPASTPRTTIEP